MSLTKIQIAAFFRLVEADASESALIRNAAGKAADSLDSTEVDGMIQFGQGAFGSGAEDSVKLTAISVAVALALAFSPDFPS